MRNLTKLLVAALLSLIAISASAASDGWNIVATDHSNYHGVLLGNGHIGILSSAELFHSQEIVLAGVFDSYNETLISRVQSAPIFTNLDIWIDGEKLTLDNVDNWNQTIDMKDAALTTTLGFGGKCKISYKLLALRNLPYCAMAEVKIEANKDVNIKVVNKYSVPKSLSDATASFKDGSLPVYWVKTKSYSGRHIICSASILSSSEGLNIAAEGLEGQSFTKDIAKGKTFNFSVVGASCTTKEFKDPVNEAKRQAVYCWKQAPATLEAAHQAAWDELWKGDIIVEGNLRLQQDIRLALYHLYSSACTDAAISLAPMGLSTSTGYNGHYFWDTETWMYPPLMVLNQKIGASLLKYRYNGLAKACQNAANHGYAGAMYPWEGDTDYEEVTPVWALTGAFEHHITADIAIAMWNYYQVYKDKEWLRTVGYPVIKQVAEFWKSRVTPSADGRYSILNVVGADEYAINVDNNAFTNGAAKLALLDAVAATRELGLPIDPAYQKIADNLSFTYSQEGVMMEYDGYKGQTIKQADVNLLAYPLDLIQEKAQIKRDVEYYKKVMDPNGPAMGGMILSILYQKIGETDSCYDLFLESYRSRQRAPFGVLTESPNSQNPYFMTGAGGLLQAVIFGFGGLEITPSGIVQHPTVLPKGIKSLTITGVGPDRKTYTVK